MLDIRGKSREERIHKLVLETSLRHSVLGQYHSPDVMTDEEIYEIFSKIEHRIYYTIDSPKFEMNEVIGNKLMTKTMTCGTMMAKDTQGIIDIILMNSDKYFIYYNLWTATPDPFNTRQYYIRGVFVDDPIIKRDNKINIVLGE